MTVRDILLAAGGAQQEVIGQIEFASSSLSQRSFVVPAGVTSISAIVVGNGSGGGQNQGGRGGDLRYINNLSVSPGETLTIRIGYSSDNQSSSIRRGSTVLVAARSGRTPIVLPSSTIGGNIGGGDGGIGGNLGGGGAGGYAGNGGRGSDMGAGNSTAGNGGGGGGGGTISGGLAGTNAGGGGGGVGIFGQGANGYRGLSPVGGGGGSGGTNGGNGATTPTGGSGGTYGGGGGGTDTTSGFGSGGSGIVRIIWPGDKRFFPSTRTADE